MIYLIWYLAVGIVVLLVLFISHRLQSDREQKLIKLTHELITSLDHTRKTWRDDLFDKIVLPLLAAFLIPAAWPVVLLMLLKIKLFPYKEELLPEREFHKLSPSKEEPLPERGVHELFPYVAELLPERGFFVHREDLIRQMTIEEIEQQEHVADPMRAVPDLPFGHLNAAWVEFKANLEQQDSVWSFAAQWAPDWGRKEIREGYVILRGDNVGQYFLKSLRELEYVKVSGIALDNPTF